MSEEKLQEIEEQLKDVEISETFKSPAGDKATELLDKLFTQVEVFLETKLPDNLVRDFITIQLGMIHAVIRKYVEKQLS